MKNKILNEMFSLNKMWSAIILSYVYRIGLIVIPLLELFLSITQGAASVILTLIIFIPLTILVWRISIELPFVIFGIYDKLASIDAKIK